MADYRDRPDIWLKEESHRARKRFGQNFLHDPRVIASIVNAIHPQSNDFVVEIGPGKGAITEGLLEGGCRLNVIELDRDLVPILQAKFGDRSGFAIHEADALSFDFAALAEGQPLRVVGNLPYNISTPLIFHLLQYHAIVTDMHFMLQLEVVNRLAAQPGSKAYGRLSVIAQYFCRVDSLFEVPPGAFDPPPKVQSAIVRLRPFTELPCVAKDFPLFERVVKAAFAQRRKTLRNTLKGLVDADTMESVGIDPGARAERISVAHFVELSNAVANQ